MHCLIIKILELLSPIAEACVKGFREGNQVVRELRASAQALQKKCTELEESNRVAESKIQTLQQKLVAAQTTIVTVGPAVVWSMILPKRVAIPLDFLALGVATGLLLCPSAMGVKRHAHELSRRLVATQDLFVQAIRRRIRDLKSVPASQSFSTTP